MKFEQDLVPRSVNPSLNLSTNKILFFAGGAGDWAYCFAQNGISVHFTDSSSEIIRKVKKKFPNSFTEIEVSDAIKLPKHKTDELMISFEPTPLYGGPLLFFLPRALALSKGVIIIQRQNLSPSPINEISIISRLYSLKVEFGLCSFICKYREEKRYKKRWLLFYRLVANEKMKKLLKADFQKFSKLT